MLKLHKVKITIINLFLPFIFLEINRGSIPNVYISEVRWLKKGTFFILC